MDHWSDDRNNVITVNCTPITFECMAMETDYIMQYQFYFRNTKT